MLSIWDSYPAAYREREVGTVLQAVKAGECVAIVGLSGAGKSNLLGFMAHRLQGDDLPDFLLLDCNRLVRPSVWAFLDLLDSLLGDENEDGPAASLRTVQARLGQRLAGSPKGLCLLVDRLDALPAEEIDALAGSLRALRDAFKYALTFVVATRRSLLPDTELAELFYANTLWLGALSQADARWSAAQYAARRGQAWDADVLGRLADFSQGYPSMLRAACEAYAAGASLEAETLEAHPAVRRRVDEFWRDRPSEGDLRLSGLLEHPWLGRASGAAPWQSASPESQPNLDTSELSASEFRLLAYFQAHPGEVCSKDDLIAAVWPEEVHAVGLRDDSLAQLVRRLRLKVEADPSRPRRIKTVPGRGYLWAG